MRETQRGFSGTIAIIALVVAIIAFIIAWMAYERTGADLDQRIREATQQTSDTIEEGAQQGADAIDKGPDGVDQDDTDTTTPQDATQPQ